MLSCLVCEEMDQKVKDLKKLFNIMILEYIIDFQVKNEKAQDRINGKIKYCLFIKRHEKSTLLCCIFYDEIVFLYNHLNKSISI